MEVLVTGASGQLGWDVCQELTRRKIAHRGTSSQELDITDAAAVERLLAAERPDVVLHCAAYTQVDQAETEPERAFAVNEGGTRNLAAACRQINARMVYISTDYVFPGVGDAAYGEDDPTGPHNVYGASKLAGEWAVEDLLERFFIVRISWVFGRNGNNFVKTMLRLAQTHHRLNVVCDQIGSPTYTADLAPLLCDMMETERYGVYHATNEGLCSWAEFAEEIFRQAGKPVKVHPVTTAEYGAKAPRPLNSRLRKDRLALANLPALPHWKDALGRFLEEIGATGS